jgi:hypothetical protein
MEVAAVIVEAATLPLKALLARLGFDQGPIHREVFVRHVRLSPGHDALQKVARQFLIQQAVAILREDRRIPNPVVHRKPDEPAKQDVVIELLHQQPLAADRIENLEQLCAEKPLRWNRRPSDVRVEPIEVPRQLTKDLVDEPANSA